jgi:MFS transporter, SP family, arabinose:H+ symporter
VSFGDVNRNPLKGPISMFGWKLLNCLLSRSLNLAIPVSQLKIPGGVFVLVFMMIYIGSFGFTLGPVVWVLISEMFPTEIRGNAIAMTSAVLWLATFLIVMVSPWLLNIGASTNFMVFGVLNILGFIFCYKYLPETKGKTLEEMIKVWREKGYLRSDD